MGYFKDVVTDVCEEWAAGKTLGEIARGHGIAMGKVFEILNEFYDEDLYLHAIESMKKYVLE